MTGLRNSANAHGAKHGEPCPECGELLNEEGRCDGGRPGRAESPSPIEEQSTSALVTRRSEAFGLHSLSVEALLRVRLVYLRKIEDFIAGRTPIRGHEGEYTDLLHWLDAANAECARRRKLLLRFA